MHTCFVYLFSMWIECNAFCNVASFMVLDQPYFDYDFVLILKMWTNSFNFLFFCLHPSSQAYPSTYRFCLFYQSCLDYACTVLCMHNRPHTPTLTPSSGHECLLSTQSASYITVSLPVGNVFLVCPLGISPDSLLPLATEVSLALFTRALSKDIYVVFIFLPLQ